MEIPNSVIDPATAVIGRDYPIAFRDDEWEDWNGSADIARYRGRRAESGRWECYSADGSEQIDWTYRDDEIVVLGDAF
ncbi:MAG: hypothetical protein WAV90_03825 [Gordonia amarae]